ncbi:MAG: hypothetical protein GF330_01340, partial [Candidatus Eisenbacteria bacterium]|nr:hypothetical protein [Candidatus Eisenbacteria bacterium]
MVVDEELGGVPLSTLRVLHVQKSHGLGGSERHIIELAAGLRERGVA